MHKISANGSRDLKAFGITDLIPYSCREAVQSQTKGVNSTAASTWASPPISLTAGIIRIEWGSSTIISQTHHSTCNDEVCIMFV